MKEKLCTEPSRGISITVLKTKLKIRLNQSVFVPGLESICSFRDGSCQGS